MKNNTENCPCDSGNSYSDCCQPYHEGLQKPSTSEKLMRSRYSAYYLALVDYLIMTTHPEKRRPNYRQELEKGKHDTDWKGLEVISTTMGGKSDKIGKVKFVAHYEMNGKSSSMEEHSRFKRYKGNWVYFDDKG